MTQVAQVDGPDQGRAWVIAIAACIINMILSGISRMIGILYVAVIHEYGATRQEATVPFTVRNSIRCLAGPLVGLAGQRYGIRVVTFCGGIVAALGAALCSIAPSVFWLTVFWGGFHGFGFAFANTLFQVVVNQYFEKYRATASGIALSGACLGSLGFPFMFESILDSYNLSGTFLILGGVIMHVLPASILLMSPPWIKNPPNRNDEPKNSYELPKSSHEQHESQTVIIEEPPTMTKEEEDLKICRQIRSTSFNNCPVDGIELLNVQRASNAENIPSDRSPNLGRNQNGNNSCGQVVCTIYKKSSSPKTGKQDVLKNKSVETTEPSIYTLPNVVPQQNGDLTTEEFKTEDTSNRYQNQSPISFLDNIMSIVRLYRNPVYLLISICMSTYVIIFIPILTVLVDYSKDKGLPESNGKYLINAMAFGDLIGRLGFGWVTDRDLIAIPKFMMLALTLQGLFIALFPFAMSLGAFMALLALYGMMAGSMLILFPILVLKYVSEDEQSVAMGCVGFLSGVLSFGIPPLIGHFRDEVGSYDDMFYLTGGVSVVSGALWLLEPAMAKLHYERKENKELNSSTDIKKSPQNS